MDAHFLMNAVQAIVDQQRHIKSNISYGIKLSSRIIFCFERFSELACTLKYKCYYFALTSLLWTLWVMNTI